LECWGAQGGDQSRTNHSSGSGSGITPSGGKGAYVCGQILLSKGIVYAYVGEQGGYNNTTRTITFNGGGAGASDSGTDGSGSRGGGATDFRTTKHSDSNGWGGDASLNSRIIVAAGGGGCTTYGTVTNSTRDGSGGPAGGLIGYSGLTTVKTGGSNTSLVNTYAANATGGTQSGGGSGWKWNGSLSSSSNGNKGYGGGSSATREGGGGGGLYGGGSGGVVSHVVASGAGGSSFISGHPGCASITGYVFTTGTTKMIDGKGLTWTTSSQTTGGTAEQMPTTSGGQEALNAGHSGDGYAKITSQ